MRSYRRTRFDIDPSGFAVATDGGPGHIEKKIDLPESWVKGFLQVHSAMSLGLTRFRMAPVDLYNIGRFLRRRKAKASPRALRYELEPGEPVRAVLEPWEHVIELSPAARRRRSWTDAGVYEGSKPLTVRTWGRDRLADAGAADPGLPAHRRLPGGLRAAEHLRARPGAAPRSRWPCRAGPTTTGPAGAKFDLLTRRLAVAPPS